MILISNIIDLNMLTFIILADTLFTQKQVFRWLNSEFTTRNSSLMPLGLHE